MDSTLQVVNMSSEIDKTWSSNIASIAGASEFLTNMPEEDLYSFNILIIESC